MHLGKSAQKKRFKKLEKDPLTRWRVTKLQWQHWRMYDKFVAAAERALQRTSTSRSLDDRRRRGRAISKPDRGHDDPRRDSQGARAGAAASASRSHRRDQPAPARVDARRSAQQSRRQRQRSWRSHAHGADDAEQPRHVAVAVEEGVRDGAGKVPGPAESPAAKGAGQGHVDDHGVRRLGRGGQGRRDPAHHRRARRTVVPGDSDRRADRRGARAALSLALLASPVARRAAHDLRPQLVRPRAGRAGRGICAPSRNGGAPTREINEFEEQLVDHGIVLVKYWVHITAGRAAPALQGTREGAVQAMEAHRRGLAQSRASGPTTSARSTRWSSGPARGWRRGRSSKATTSTSRGSRY